MAIKDVFAVNSIFLSISPMNLKQIIDREKNQQIEVVTSAALCVERKFSIYTLSQSSILNPKLT